jgi:hypothetical protein
MGRSGDVGGGMIMKTNYLIAIASVIALGEYAASLFPVRVFPLLNVHVGVINWKCAMNLGIWIRILVGAAATLGSSAWDSRVAVFVVTHAACWIVNFLSGVFAWIV